MRLEYVDGLAKAQFNIAQAGFSYRSLVKCQLVILSEIQRNTY